MTAKDLEYLFSTIGSIKKTKIFLTEDGTSSGIGEVIFFRHTDATIAMKRFNIMALDGRPMRLKFVSDKKENKIEIIVEEMRVAYKLSLRAKHIHKELEVKKLTKCLNKMKLGENKSETKSVKPLQSNNVSQC